MDNNGKKSCFIITPIGEVDSKIFRKTKGVIESVIKPVLFENGFHDIKPSYEITESGLIGNQIVNRIIYDDLVVANLTGNNPNVMYELALRHTIAKPIIHICENGTKLPFDIANNRTIFYDDDMYGTQELMQLFKKFVNNIDYTKDYIDNPICNGTYKLINIIQDSKKADILIRLKAKDCQLKNFIGNIIKEYPFLSITGFKKVGEIFLIYIKNDSIKSFENVVLLMQKISENIGIKVIFYDDMKIG